MRYYIIQNIIETNVISFPGYVMPSRLPPRDCVSQPCPLGPRLLYSALANARMRASLSHCVIAQAMRHTVSRPPRSIGGIDLEVYVAKTHRADTARVLPVALSYVASSLAEPRPRIRECLTPRVYVASRNRGAALSRTLRSSARPRYIN